MLPWQKKEKKSLEKKNVSYRELKLYYSEYPGLYSDFWIYPLFNVLFISAHIVLLVITLYYSFYVNEDLGVAAEAGHFIGILINAIAYIISGQLNKKSFKKLFSSLDEGLFKYKETIDPDTEAEILTIVGYLTNRKKRVISTLEVLYNSAFVFCTIVIPILAGRFSPSNQKDNDSLTRQTLVVAWFPYDTKGWAGWLFSLVSEYFIGFLSLCLLNTADLPFANIAEEICKELEILKLTIHNVLRRSRFVYKMKYGTELKSLDDKKFKKCLQECFNDSVRHHIRINRFFEVFVYAHRIIVFTIMMSGVLLLCMSGLIFLSKRVNIAIKLTFMIYLSSELTHTFMYACYGELIKNLSNETRDQVYYSEWVECSKDMLPYIIMIQGRTNKPLKLSAGGFVECNFSTFGNVVSSAYSYINLLRAAIDF